MATLKNIALVGASGNIGKIILESLVVSSDFDITVVLRKESKAVFPSGVAVHKSDFSVADLVAVFKGKDAVISALGATAFGEQKKLVDAAISAGVEKFVPSEFSASSQNDTVIQLLPLFGQKKELIEYLKTKEAGGFNWTGIATSGLLDWNPEQTKNKYLYVASVETTQREILTALEKATGTEWTVQETTTETQLSVAAKKLTGGDFEGAFILVRATVFGNSPGLNANYVKDTELANDILGLKLESVEETVKRVVNK